MQWLDRELLDLQRSIASSLLAKFRECNDTSPVASAITPMLARLIKSGDSITILECHSPHDSTYDSATIMRNIYDVMLQALYILINPEKRLERAQRCLDFIELERKVRITTMDTNATDLAQHVSKSPKRSASEKEIDEKFLRVKEQFTTKKGKLVDHWYPGTLRDLAREVGYEDEYEIMQRQLSGVVHSSPLTLIEGPFLRGPSLSYSYWVFAFRVLGSLAEHARISLSETEQRIIDSSKRNIFNWKNAQ